MGKGMTGWIAASFVTGVAVCLAIGALLGVELPPTVTGGPRPPIIIQGANSIEFIVEDPKDGPIVEEGQCTGGWCYLLEDAQVVHLNVEPKAEPLMHKCSPITFTFQQKDQNGNTVGWPVLTVATSREEGLRIVSPERLTDVNSNGMKWRLDTTGNRLRLRRLEIWNQDYR